MLQKAHKTKASRQKIRAWDAIVAQWTGAPKMSRGVTGGRVLICVLGVIGMIKTPWHSMGPVADSIYIRFILAYSCQLGSANSARS